MLSDKQKKLVNELSQAFAKEKRVEYIEETLSTFLIHELDELTSENRELSQLLDSITKGGAALRVTKN